MKNIFNLIYLQFNSLFTLKKNLLIIVVFSIIFTFIQPDMLTIAPLMYLMVSTYSLTFYEEKSQFNYLVYTLPIKLNDYILSKFIYSFINVIITVGISSILYLAVKFTGKGSALINLPMYAVLITVFFVGLFFMCIVVPASIILGFEKGRYVMIFVAVFPVVFSMSLAEKLPSYPLNISNSFLIIIGILLSITFILASYFITSNLFARKEIL